jgi:capsular polysaccharide transport system ATP-binding protein
MPRRRVRFVAGPMIRFENVLKFYKIQRYRKIVLNHVSINLEAGVSYGIMGVNGAGKSTFVRLIAGSELPNSGRIQRSVRLSWPLGFTGGIHPSLTGRENIQFLARVYGERPSNIIEFVEDFAEIGPYLDAPVKTYSSGMIARVAFGLSMAINFECYLIDEVMAVGDARFQARCQAEFRKRKEHSDLIMVSHSTETLREYCDRGIVLADGRLHYFHDVDDAIELYRRINM